VLEKTCAAVFDDDGKKCAVLIDDEKQCAASIDDVDMTVNFLWPYILPNEDSAVPLPALGNI
jgi:hypothetical protein